MFYCSSCYHVSVVQLGAAGRCSQLIIVGETGDTSQHQQGGCLLGAIGIQTPDHRRDHIKKGGHLQCTLAVLGSRMRGYLSVLSNEFAHFLGVRSMMWPARSVTGCTGTGAACWQWPVEPGLGSGAATDTRQATSRQAPCLQNWEQLATRRKRAAARWATAGLL